MAGTRKTRVPMVEQIRLINECRQSGMTDADWCRENDIAVSTFYNWVQFAPHGGHWCVCQRPPGGAQRPPSLRYFDRLNNNNVMLRCPLHNSVG